MTPPAQRKSGRVASQRRRTSAGQAGTAAPSVPPLPVEPAQELKITDFPDLPALAHYVRQGRCALFVGAGLSTGAGLPAWHGLMERIVRAATPFAVGPEKFAELELAGLRTRKAQPDVVNPLSQKEIMRLFTRMLGRERCAELFEGGPGAINLLNVFAYNEAMDRVRRDSITARELEALLTAGKFPELAGYCRDLLGRRRFHEQVRRELSFSGAIPDVHRSIVRTPYACIVTTNFDSLLEDAYAQWGDGTVPRAPTGAELARQGTLLFDDTFFILKAHGDLDDESSIIFTSEDYRRVIHSNPAFQAMLTGILLRHAVLFVGYSLSDVNFRLLLDNQLTIFNEEVPPRYALMDGVGEAEREILWRTARLRVFGYEKGRHEVVGRFLNTLATQASAPTEEKEAAARTAAVLPKGIVARPAEKPRFDLAIDAVGDRLVIALHELRPDAAPRTLWSGGGSWPDWAALRRGLTNALFDEYAELSTLSAIGAYLQRCLPDELFRHLEAVPPGVTVTLSLAAATETVPWEWLIVQGSPLCLLNPVVRRPTGISDKARGLRLARDPLRALVIGDAGYRDPQGGSPTRLDGATEEARRIGELLQARGATVTTLEREAAVYARVVAEVQDGDYDVIHFAGHAWYQGAEAILHFWDGTVSSSELASILKRRPPTLLVLNSHVTAFMPCGALTGTRTESAATGPPGVDRPLPPPLGFMGLASRSGVGAFVGSFAGAVPDVGAGEFAVELYRGLADGQRFADSLLNARRATTNFKDTTGLVYVGSGDPDVVVAAPPSR
jgi:hypothetical protein